MENITNGKPRGWTEATFDQGHFRNGVHPDNGKRKALAKNSSSFNIDPYSSSINTKKEKDNGDHGSNSSNGGGMFLVDSDQVSDLMYVGNDAVHTLGIESFHAPIQEEINKRMSLVQSTGRDSTLRFAPTSLNPAIEKNVDLILGLTGMDQVSHIMYIYCYSSYIEQIHIFEQMF